MNKSKPKQDKAEAERKATKKKVYKEEEKKNNSINTSQDQDVGGKGEHQRMKPEELIGWVNPT